LTRTKVQILLHKYDRENVAAHAAQLHTCFADTKVRALLAKVRILTPEVLRSSSPTLLRTLATPSPPLASTRYACTHILFYYYLSTHARTPSLPEPCQLPRRIPSNLYQSIYVRWCLILDSYLSLCRAHTHHTHAHHTPLTQIHAKGIYAGPHKVRKAGTDEIVTAKDIILAPGSVPFVPPGIKV
jgi:hypothetical protein